MNASNARRSYKLPLRQNADGEWVVKCWKGAERFPEGDYHTPDFDDAVATMTAMQNAERKALEGGE